MWPCAESLRQQEVFKAHVHFRICCVLACDGRDGYGVDGDLHRRIQRRQNERAVKRAAQERWKHDKNNATTIKGSAGRETNSNRRFFVIPKMRAKQAGFASATSNFIRFFLFLSATLAS
jgi:hypothetical protein